MIGDDVIVQILGIKGNQIRIGVSAPKSIVVHREEIFLQVKREREAAAPIVAAADSIPDAPWAAP
jgi:carbon storage regulator